MPMHWEGLALPQMPHCGHLHYLILHIILFIFTFYLDFYLGFSTHFAQIFFGWFKEIMQRISKTFLLILILWSFGQIIQRMKNEKDIGSYFIWLFWISQKYNFASPARNTQNWIQFEEHLVSYDDAVMHVAMLTDRCTKWSWCSSNPIHLKLLSI